MSETPIDENKRLRQFGGILGCVCLGLGILSFYKDSPLILSLCFWTGTCLSWLFALVAPRFLAPLEKILIKVGNFMAPIFTGILLTLVFFLIVTPMALLFKIGGKRPLVTNLSEDEKSYWIPHAPEASTRHERQF